ncbi:methyltransferase for 50S ribosomal subunit protein L11 [Candidatus Methylocalor cossyra]|uniref:Ribosomal protein L11 methyltransferase n=1 Tax=Candidatus Methylocalor cossyra TaxID=3108543 RepID=A0ABM9NE62_9GAMM
MAATVEEALAESVSERFLAEGALSVTLEDAGDQPLFEPKPGETPLWKKTRVIALFAEGVDEAGVRATLMAAFGGGISTWESATLEDRVWERAWLEHFRPMRFGRRLWVCPSGFEPPEPEAVNLCLDPGLAFGTGTHPTTALCLEWLDGQTLSGKTVLDYGCGSGILAIAALKLGANRAYGVDIDPQALTASADNARKNGVASRLRLSTPAGLPALGADLVLANILAGPLVALADQLVGQLRPGGDLVLSGLLAAQAEAVRAAYQGQIQFAAPVIREGWALLTGVKRLR